METAWGADGDVVVIVDDAGKADIKRAPAGEAVACAAVLPDTAKRA